MHDRLKNEDEVLTKQRQQVQKEIMVKKNFIFRNIDCLWPRRHHSHSPSKSEFGLGFQLIYFDGEKHFLYVLWIPYLFIHSFFPLLLFTFVSTIFLAGLARRKILASITYNVWLFHHVIKNCLTSKIFSAMFLRNIKILCFYRANECLMSNVLWRDKTFKYCLISKFQLFGLQCLIV